jgi:hypothetical protein
MIKETEQYMTWHIDRLGAGAIKTHAMLYSLDGRKFVVFGGNILFGGGGGNILFGGGRANILFGGRTNRSKKSG